MNFMLDDLIHLVVAFLVNWSAQNDSAISYNEKWPISTQELEFVEVSPGNYDLLVESASTHLLIRTEVCFYYVFSAHFRISSELASNWLTLTSDTHSLCTSVHFGPISKTTFLLIRFKMQSRDSWLCREASWTGLKANPMARLFSGH